MGENSGPALPVIVGQINELALGWYRALHQPESVVPAGQAGITLTTTRTGAQATVSPALLAVGGLAFALALVLLLLKR